ncbi:MAG TPA: methylmalonyl-CoA mutase family protein [Thermoanaerobaculia bacterium]|nr:methylmalonyl-CoA mutase family protein [Thermoanaerobaculia bacterium]
MSVKEESPVLPLTPEQERIRKAKESWREKAAAAFGRTPPWRKDFTTVSSAEVNPLATPDDLPGFDFERDLGWPGEFPYTRGVQATMYRGRPWTIRQFAGFGSARDTNDRFKKLLAHGQTGLSTAFHLPTLYGYDSDHPMAAGEVGKCGVAVDTLRDFEILFDGIDLGAVTTSMTINSTAPIALAMYLAVAEKNGTPFSKVGGTLQNDILKEYIAQKEYIFPPRPSMRLVTDQFAFCAKHVPRWNTVSVSGYHIREAGSTALQELAFTLRDGMEYVKYGVEAGLPVDEFAPRLSFFFNAHNDFFEEIAKYRAARRIWAKVLRDRYGAKRPESWKLRFHTQTAGVSLTAQQPYNNVARVAIQALAAVLGGTQSLHTNALDETLALPTEFAAKIGVRTQQIVLHETGVANTIDPLGGAYFVEEATNRMEAGAFDYFRRIDAYGGMVEAIEAGFPQREIMDAAYRFQRAFDARDKVMVGVNGFTESVPEDDVPILTISEETAGEQIRALGEVRRTRDARTALQKLSDLRAACRGGTNVMPPLLEAVKAYATVGEISDVMREVFAVYEEPAVF